MIEIKDGDNVVSVERVALDKALADKKLRIVNMEDVTVKKEDLAKALIKIGIPGNESNSKAETILGMLLLGDQYGGQRLEESGETSSEETEGNETSTD